MHDAAGNGTTLPRPGDEANTLTCVYDAWNRLVEVKIGATTIERNEYDGLNRRVVKQFDSAAPANPDGLDAYRHYYYNSAWQIVETRKSDSAATAPQTLQPEWQYVWSPRYLDAAVLRDRNADADDLCDDERLYYCNDANMNVTTLIDANGDAVERYAYDAYGQPTVYDGTWSNTRSASNYDNEILYCGYVFDWPTRLYHVRHRPYHPTMGQWTVRDYWMGYAPGMNLYEYCIGNPSKWSDPEGLDWWPPWNWGWDREDQLRTIEEDSRQTADRARQMAENARKEQEVKRAESLEKLADESQQNADTIRGRIDQAQKDEFDRSNWDRTNGTMEGLTFGKLDLSSIGYADKDPKTGKAYVFDEKTRRENECFAKCWADATLNAVNPTGIPVNPWEDDKPPIETPGLGDIAPGGFTTIGKIVQSVANRKYGQGHEWKAHPMEGPDGFGRMTRYENKFKETKGQGKTLERIGKALNVIMYMAALNKCREKCFCDE